MTSFDTISLALAASPESLTPSPSPPSFRARGNTLSKLIGFYRSYSCNSNRGLFPPQLPHFLMKCPCICSWGFPFGFRMRSPSPPYTIFKVFDFSPDFYSISNPRRDSNFPQRQGHRYSSVALIMNFEAYNIVSLT